MHLKSLWYTLWYTALQAMDLSSVYRVLWCAPWHQVRSNSGQYTVLHTVHAFVSGTRCALADGHRHAIRVVPGTPLAEWFAGSLKKGKKPNELMVNSYHHQVWATNAIHLL